ncbi:hypothetical protein I7I50_00814 [Histoplasma capsulatum G186AR]|uniref:Uncharacterized protein n=1 Tax=Ajellomyces capsulatus TaxID=5037 RepID=A0A8H7YG93_AJECA|nr:hypothetical protein I7I52_08082 [Histoplasma capsulatum]QSS72844.1 hypothetical protein I7I50_00814 [Histoplasma capsulatum G186AR]
MSPFGSLSFPLFDHSFSSSLFLKLIYYGNSSCFPPSYSYSLPSLRYKFSTIVFFHNSSIGSYQRCNYKQPLKPSCHVLLLPKAKR